MATEQQVALTQTAHPMLPRPLAKPGLVKWLKKLHAWIGIFGVLATIIFAWSGFNLNHRTDFKLGREPIVTESTMPAPAGGFATPEEFRLYVRSEFEMNGAGEVVGPNDAPGGMGAAPAQPKMQVSFRAASNDLVADYVIGSSEIAITETVRPFQRLVNRLHVGRGTGPLWISLINVYSVMLIFLSLTGMLIWSKLSGSRFVGGGIIATTFVLMAWFIFAGP